MNTEWVKKLRTPIALVGLGKSGKSAYNFLIKMGFSDKDLITYDDKDSSALFTKSELLIEKSPNTLVISPGYPLKKEWIKQLANSGAFITSEISLASSVLTTEKVVGVTGSIGKSTVTSLIGEAFKVADPNAFVGGNLGIPFCEYAIKILTGGNKAKWIALELSSYQLENCKLLKLEHSAITYLSPNHLERYSTLEEYYQTKLGILEITQGKCVINGTSLDTVKLTKQFADKIVQAHATHDQINLIGPHNRDNYAVALELTKLCKLQDPSIQAMKKYAGLSHRLEKVGTFKGITYINDSKATATDSVQVAVKGCLESLPKHNCLYLLLGGRDKKLPWEELATLKIDSRLRFVFFGECGKEISYQADLAGPYFLTLKEATQHCKLHARAGDTVLLSPGGTSLDEFKNFEERGNFFKQLVSLQND